MNYVEKLFDEVHFAFKLNAATLSGAIDILVVPQTDGSLKCTPFHIRFGKLQLISSSEKIISIYVNAQKTDLQMKLGHAGEAFFVEETEEPVPSILATSPITSPKQSRAAASKKSTEELLPEFQATRIMYKPPVIQQTTTTTMTTTTTTTTTINNLEPSEMRPLTSAIEEMIIKQKGQQPHVNNNNNNPLPAITTNNILSKSANSALHITPSSSASTTAPSSPTTSSIKKGSPLKRTSSPVFFEGSEDITLDSPINSYIINYESETPIDTPIGSPSEINVTTPPLENSPPNSSARKLSDSHDSVVNSDSESEQKVGFWRWGGLPKFIRGKTTNATAAASPPSSNTTSPQQTNSHITSPTASITVTSTSTEATITQQQQQQQLTSDLSDTTGVLVESNTTTSAAIVEATLEAGESGGEQETKSWGKAAFKKIFNKRETSAATSTAAVVEPTYLVKPPTEPPQSMDNLDTGAEPQIFHFEEDEHDIHDQKNDSSSEEQHQQRPRKPQKQQQQQQQQERVQEVPDKDDRLDQYSANRLLMTMSTNNEQSYASIVKGLDEQGGDSLPPLIPISDSMEKLSDIVDDADFPPLAASRTPNRPGRPARGQMHAQLSLCGHLILDRNLQSEPEERERFFQEHIVSHEQLCSDVALFKNPHLVAKIESEYYPWTIAGHYIMSHLVFNRPLSVEALESLRKKDKEERTAAKTAAPPGSSRHSWINGKQQDVAHNNKVHQQMIEGQSSNLPIVVSPPLQSKQIVQQQPNQQLVQTTPPSMPPHSYVKKSLRPTSAQLKSLGLKKGVNTITFVVSSTLQGTRELTASIYLWDNDSKIVISDIDGTITKSDALGHLLPAFGKDWSHIGVAELYSNIKENGYQIMYLSSRAIGQAGITRNYISWVKQTSASNLQNDPQMPSWSLPAGPVFMSPNRLLTSFNREVIKKNPEEFKIACLQDIQNIFPPGYSPFYAGFGNRSTDVAAYSSVGIPAGKTFTINPNGIINTSNNTYNKSYTKLNDLVQDMFPSITSGSKHIDEQWNEYHYWKKKSIIPLDKLEPL
ncbi:hypothetical protein SAMD00019534_031260 [Acytostelium subglobosum LB1]|uniref:hypothetical protein n=1 Tax=Acytostelium subglobosum LB1 TaxID=1410327 RepID=UPI000644C28A|nr:hypothetical protein SAMD00019534_031260 [Acytostelium subglobosum LB1]GAM19951.1 hypothetical protein SAMD00019534_031260 [Acytostelium subglobosum LB1]|eukprot:XP_012756713.1 hypothetical protein SAMD00019534_031260 [Acytostelium subglobosum LB1]